MDAIRIILKDSYVNASWNPIPKALPCWLSTAYVISPFINPDTSIISSLFPFLHCSLNPLLDRDDNMDPKIKALKRKGVH